MSEGQDPVTHRPRVLVVDDENTIRGVISQVLADDGYEVTEAASGEEALNKFLQDPFPIVMTDVVMGKMNGLQLLEEVRLLDENTLVIVMTSQASLETATSALRSGAYDFLIKPFEDLDMITAVVSRATDKVRLLNHNETLMKSLKQNHDELERLNDNLREIASRDGLTNLYNHRFFREALERELARAKRHDRCFSILFMDVDCFKQYNDTHGHLAGDELLKTLANLLLRRARASSVVARYGGEEFVILVPEADRDGALRYAVDIRENVEKHNFPGEETQPQGNVTISVGVASFPDDGQDSRELLNRADEALYQAKQNGRNTVCG